MQKHPATTQFTSTLPGLLKVSGPDAKKFLQGQLTCNLDEISDSKSLLGAHCNPKGRVLFLFRIFSWQEAYYLVMPASMVALALRFLKKYAVFFKLSLEDVSQYKLPQAAQEWQYFNPFLGIPQVYPETSGLFLPHDLGLQDLQGISWEKGCYTGQEIIARMHYRGGKLKNQLYRATIQTRAHPQPGSELLSSSGDGYTVSGQVIDCQPQEDHRYHLLVLTQESNHSKPLKLDPSSEEQWEWLN